MNLQEIKQAVDDGKIVCWASENYRVIKDRLNQWLIVCQINGYTVGLTWADGKTLNCNSEDEFFILENTNRIKQQIKPGGQSGIGE